jgi:hypothetical protein
MNRLAMFCALCAALISSNAALAQQMHADDLKWVNECRRTGSGIGHKSAVGQLYKRFDKASVIEAVMLSADRFRLPISTTLLEGGHWFHAGGRCGPHRGFRTRTGRARCPRPQRPGGDRARQTRDPPGQGRRTRSCATVRPRGDADVEMSRARCLGPDAIQAPPTPG